MKALSIRQPWASLVASGAKYIETRSRPAPTAIIGQRIAIHACKGLSHDGKQLCYSDEVVTALWPEILELECLAQNAATTARIAQLLRGVVIATARVTGCYSTNDLHLVERLSGSERAFGDYAPDRHMWVLNEVHLLPAPIAAKGQLGLWRWEPSVGWMGEAT